MRTPPISDRHLPIVLLLLALSGVGLGALGGFIAGVVMTGGPL